MNGNEMRYSIIVPVFNAENFIGNCLDSIFNQTFHDFEVILINDGSKDSSKEVIEKYIKGSHSIAHKIKYVEQDNQGPAAARARGIEDAVGEYIAFLDADDIWYSNKLEIVDKTIRDTEATFIYTNENMVFKNGKKRQCDYYALGSHPVEDLIIKGNPISTSTVVADSKLLKEHHTFSDGKEFGEDIACWIELAKFGAKFAYIDIPLGEYRREENSLTLSNEKYLIDTANRLLGFYDILTEYGFSKEQIIYLKNNQDSLNKYNLGRYHQKRGEFLMAKNNYRESLKKKKGIKKYMGFILSTLHIKY